MLLFMPNIYQLNGFGGNKQPFIKRSVYTRKDHDSIINTLENLIEFMYYMNTILSEK
jgi:hypothetical protein